jgi:hypothetical protein
MSRAVLGRGAGPACWVTQATLEGLGGLGWLARWIGLEVRARLVFKIDFGFIKNRFNLYLSLNLNTFQIQTSLN